MIIKKKLRIAAVGIVSLALVAGAAAVASAATQTNGSDGPLFLYSGDSGNILADGTSLAWSAAVITAGSGTSNIVGTTCPATSTGATQFLSAVGSERSAQTWSASSTGGLNPGTLDVLQANVTPLGLYNGLPGQAAIKAAGGTYSLGIACMNGTLVTGAYFRTITVTAGTGAWVVAPQADAVVTPSPTPTAPAGTAGDVALAPTVAAASNGVLSFSVPAGAAATFGAPTLVNNKSTTVGTLGAVTVSDGRVLTRNGWDLTANVADFKKSTDPANTISKAQLGFIPSVTALGTEATGVSLAPGQTAGTASYPAAFASGAAANTVGNTVLNAGLTFVAPPEKAAGTYTSVMTLTVVSK